MLTSLSRPLEGPGDRFFAPVGQMEPSPVATAIANPVALTPASIAAGKRVYDANCAACHGSEAEGAARAGITIEEQQGKQPPDLTDDQWDHGSSDGDVFRVIERGIPPTMMPGFDASIADEEIWNVVNYLRSLRSGP